VLTGYDTFYVQVRYEIVGRGKAPKYFQMDPDLGVLSVRNDLRKEADSEYQVSWENLVFMSLYM